MFKTLNRWLSHHFNHPIGTYMDRWYIIPPQWNLPICVRLQHIRRGDVDRLPHNHPYTFKSIVLKGSYVEECVAHKSEIIEWGFPEHATATYRVNHTPFRIFTIAQERYHRILKVADGGVWTLIWHPRKPKLYEWGYLADNGTHIPHAEYVQPKGYDLPYKKARK